MKTIFRRSILVLGVFGLVLWFSRPVWEFPAGVHFAAPHQTKFHSALSEMDLNSRLPTFVRKALDATKLTTVYASCKPACDGTKMVADDTGVNGQPYCYMSPTGTYECAKATCESVGGNHLCNGPFTSQCTIAGVGTMPCNYAENKKCQKQE